jgi:hypothetical protein
MSAHENARLDSSRGGPLVRDHGCCDAASSGSGRERIGAWTRRSDSQAPLFLERCRETAEWMVPTAILALSPKCPVCLAVYIAIWTGVGLSVSTGASLRTLLVILCRVSLSYIMARRARRFIARMSAPHKLRHTRADQKPTALFTRPKLRQSSSLRHTPLSWTMQER